MGFVGDGLRWTCPACNGTYSVDPDDPHPEVTLRETQRRHPNKGGRCTRRWIEAAKPLRRGRRDEIRRRNGAT